MSAYALANGLAGREHHEIIGRLWDQYTLPRITGLFPAGGLAGARVLEVGAGCGSVASWLAAQVGPSGHVYALDHDTSLIPPHPRLTPITADLNADRLPGGPFDLIHARQVLPHVHERETVLRELAHRLAPGGWLLLEDLHRPGDGFVLDAPTPQLGDLIHRTQTAIGRVFTAAGSDREWAGRVPALLRSLGLTHVTLTTHAESWTSGPHGIGAVFLAGMITQLRQQLLAHGLTEDELTTVQTALLDDTGTAKGQPGLLLRGHTLWCTAARAPGGSR